MNDLIRRKDVEQMLNDLGGCDASDKEAEGWDKAIDAAMEGLRKIESADGWIPCSERLPDNVKYNAYLTTLEGELVGEDEPFTGLCGFEHGRWDEDCVIAWRELPEPWEGE